jgi:UDP-glucose 4-epimerase
VLNVGSGRGTSLSELIAIIARVIGERPEVRYVVGRSLDVSANVLGRGPWCESWLETRTAWTRA